MNASSCIFCQIIQKTLPSAVVYETAEVFAFLDINPLTQGHTLIIPKQHAETIFDMSATSSQAIFEAIQHVGRSLMESLSADGLNVLQNNYAASGQEVGHVHWHLIPRKNNDGVQLWTKKPSPNKDTVNTLAEQIRQISMK